VRVIVVVVVMISTHGAESSAGAALCLPALRRPPYHRHRPRKRATQ